MRSDERSYRDEGGISGGTGVPAPGGGTHILYSPRSAAGSVPERARVKLVVSINGAGITVDAFSTDVDDSAGAREWLASDSGCGLMDADGSGIIGDMLPFR